MDELVVRMFDLAGSVCPRCNGEEHQHRTADYRVTGMLAYSRDLAIAWFDLTRGSVIVHVKDAAHQLWWFGTHDAAEAWYNGKKATLLSE